MTAWTGKHVRFDNKLCPEFHEYPEGMGKATFQVVGELLNMINPNTKNAFVLRINNSLFTSLRRLKLSWMQVSLPFRCSLIGAVGEEMKTWGRTIPFMAALLQHMPDAGLVNIVGPASRDEVDPQYGLWTHEKNLQFLVSRRVDIKRGSYRNKPYYNDMYAGKADTGNIITSHSFRLMKEHWQLEQVVTQARPRDAIAMLAGCQAMTAAVWQQITNSRWVDELKRRGAAFVIAANDVDKFLRTPSTPYRSWLIFRKAVISACLIHSLQVARFGSIHILNEQKMEQTLQFAKRLLRRNASTKAPALLTRIERERNTIRLGMADATLLTQTRKQIQTSRVSRLMARVQASLEPESTVNPVISSTHVVSQVGDTTTNQRKVFVYTTLPTFVSNEWWNEEVGVLSLWYSRQTQHVYVETKTTEPKNNDGSDQRYLTLIRIANTAPRRTCMQIQDTADQLFHSWFSFDNYGGVPNDVDSITTAALAQLGTTTCTCWRSVVFMRLEPIIALRHPLFPAFFHFSSLNMLERKSTGSWEC